MPRICFGHVGIYGNIGAGSECAPLVWGQCVLAGARYDWQIVVHFWILEVKFGGLFMAWFCFRGARLRRFSFRYSCWNVAIFDRMK